VGQASLLWLLVRLMWIIWLSQAAAAQDGILVAVVVLAAF
jgi:hypothetical protein